VRGVEALDNDAAHEITLGNTPTSIPSCITGNSANVTVDHGAGYVQHALCDVSAIGIAEF